MNVPFRLNQRLAALGLLVLTTACGGPAHTPPVPATDAHQLTIVLNGVDSAPVTVTRGNQLVFEGIVQNSKTLSDLHKAAYTVTGGALNGYTRPAPITADLSSSGQTVTLTYTASSTTPAPTTASLKVTVSGAPSARILVTAENTVYFDDIVAGSVILPNLPRRWMQVRANPVADRVTPLEQFVDLTHGDQGLTLTYLAPLDRTRLSGTADGWTSLEGSTFRLPARTDGAALAEGTMPSNGNLNFTLPAAVPASELFSLEPLNGQACDNHLALGNPASRVAAYSEYPVFRNGLLIGRLVERPSLTREVSVGSEFIHRWYATEATSVSGTVRCGSSTFQFNLDLKVGWNVVRARITNVSYYGAVTSWEFSSTPLLAASALVFNKVPVGFEVSSDTQNFAALAGENAPITLNVMAEGDFDANLALSLEYAPAGVTLDTSSLLARPQGLSAQTVTSPYPLTQRVTSKSPTISKQVRFLTTGDTPRGSHYFYLRVTAAGQTRTLYITLNISKPGVEAYVYSSGLQLDPTRTTLLSYSAYAHDGYSGTATVSLEGVPPGITITPGTLDLTSRTGTSGEFAFAVAKGTAPGTYGAKIVLTSTSARYTTPIELELPAPTFDVTIPNATVYAEETTTVPVSVTSLYGFSGTVDLSIANVPGYVQAQLPASVNLTEGTTSIVNVTLKADTTVTLETSTVSLSGTSGSATKAGSFKLHAKAKRYLATTDTYSSPRSLTVDTSGSAWYIGPSNLVERVAADGTRMSVASTGAEGLSAAANGQVYFTKSGAVGRITSTGTVTTWPIDTKYRYSWPFSMVLAVDADERVWYAAEIYNQTTQRYEDGLGYVDTRNGGTGFVPIPSITDFYGARQLTVHGDTLYFLANTGNGTRLFRMNLSTLAVSTLNVSTAALLYDFAVSTDGFIWFPGSDSTNLVRFDPSDESSVVYNGVKPNSSAYSELQAGPNGSLWWQDWITVDSQTVYRLRQFDPVTRQIGAYPLSNSATGVAVSLDSGVWYSFAADSRHYLSRIVP